MIHEHVVVNGEDHPFQPTARSRASGELFHFYPRAEKVEPRDLVRSVYSKLDRCVKKLRFVKTGKRSLERVADDAEAYWGTASGDIVVERLAREGHSFTVEHFLLGEVYVHFYVVPVIEEANAGSNAFSLIHIFGALYIRDDIFSRVHIWRIFKELVYSLYTALRSF